MWCCPSALSPKLRARYVNAEGRWQSWAGAARLPGESRPGWKVLRVLANLLNVRGVDYDSSEQVRDALKSLCGTRTESAARPTVKALCPTERYRRGPGWIFPRTKIDVLVRGSEALAKTKDGRLTRAVI